MTSTVTIPTPEQAMQEEAGDTPSVWEGTVVMPDVTEFKVRSYQVCSRTTVIVFIQHLFRFLAPLTT